MIKNFEVVKKQLQELAGVINGFKCEAVQLKIVELLFQRMGIAVVDREPSGRVNVKRKRLPHKNGPPSDNSEKLPRKQRASKGNRPGPGAMVNQLTSEGFFKQPKTIQSIIDHCQSKLAYSYTSSELAVALTRALRSNSLKREKNAQNQFEYSK
jgi:hypothetical protein